MAQLFVVVSTGQNVANLPPILERAEEGDQVLWVESPAARQKKWSAGARRVLEKKYKLQMVTEDVVVEQINDPVQVAQAFRGAVVRWRAETVKPLLVANGGQKLTPIGLLRACEGLQPVLLYGDDQPAQLRTYEAGLDQPPRIAPYVRHKLDLEDILLASNPAHVLSPKKPPPVCLWPGSLPAEYRQERYGVDSEYTARLHAEHHAWAQVKVTDEFTPFRRAVVVLPESRLLKWRRAFSSLVQTGNVNHDEIMAAIYNATARLIKDAARASERARQGLSLPTAKQSMALERTVGCRVVDWVQKQGTSIVQSVWANVEVVQESRPGENVAQLDVVLVLKNGILVHLECKTAEEVATDQKELDARLLNLQRAGSQLARMAVCAPVYTSFVAEPWFEGLHRLRQRLAGIGRLDFLSMTLLNQPDRYTFTDSEGMSQTYEVPPFENALAFLLNSYRPPEKPTS